MSFWKWWHTVHCLLKHELTGACRTLGGAWAPSLLHSLWEVEGEVGLTLAPGGILSRGAGDRAPHNTCNRQGVLAGAHGAVVPPATAGSRATTALLFSGILLTWKECAEMANELKLALSLSLRLILFSTAEAAGSLPHIYLQGWTPFKINYLGFLIKRKMIQVGIS